MALHDVQAGVVSCDAVVSYELQRCRCFFLKCICRACEAVPMGMVLAIGQKQETRRGSYHIVREPSPGRVMKSCLECLKLEAAEMAQKKPLLSLPSNAQLVSNL